MRTHTREGTAPGAAHPARAVALSALLGLAVGLSLLVGIRTGHTGPGGRVAVSVILVALPSVPADTRAAVRTLATRTGLVVLAALFVAAVDGHEVAVAAGIVVAAAVGYSFPIVGTTAALAVLLSGLRVVSDPHSLALPGLWELVGALVVVLAALLTRAGQSRSRLSEPAGEVGTSWTVRRVASVAVAVLLALATPLGVYGGHWLITAVLLSVRPTPAATRVRLTQRLLGNTVAAVLVAALMASGVGPTALAVVVGVLTGTALALRPVSYLWWAVAAPPALLIVGDYPVAHDWYEGVERVGLNVLGAAIVLAVCHLPRERRSRPAAG